MYPFEEAMCRGVSWSEQKHSNTQKHRSRKVRKLKQKKNVRNEEKSQKTLTYGNLVLFTGF